MDDSLALYRPISGLAVAGLVLGLLSPLALIDPALWVAPLAGLLLSGVAWARIAARRGELGGRGLAVAGLIASLLMAVAAPGDWLLYRWAMRREARQFAEEWFALLAENRPQEAYQLTLHPASRLPFDEHLPEFYRDDPNWQAEVDNYVAQAPVDKLLALGPKARVAYCRTMGQGPDRGAYRVEQVFEVSEGEEGGEGDSPIFAPRKLGQSPTPRKSGQSPAPRKSGQSPRLLILLHLSRYTLDAHRANWRVDKAEAISDF